MKYRKIHQIYGKNYVKIGSIRNFHGFSAVELLVVISIVAVLAGLASPSFRPLIERWRVRQATEDLQASLYLARTEAVKRGGNIVVRKLPDGDGCTTSAATEWTCGWFVFYDTNANGAQNADQTPPEDTLQRLGAPTATTVTVANSNGFITVDRWGQFASNSSNSFSFRVIPAGKTDADPNANTLCVRSGGQIKRLNSGNASC